MASKIARRERPRYISKPGAHGTLYRYEVRYRDNDPSAPIFTWRCWAYDSEHACDKWHDSNAATGDDGWIVVSGPTRVREAR